MINFNNISYNKEYKELIQAFIPNIEDEGLLMDLKIKDKNIIIKINKKTYEYLLKDQLKEKTSIKQGIYKALSNYTKKSLQWGILVGVNPLKLIRKLLEKYERDETRRILEDLYFIKKEKIDLSFQVIDNQKEAIKKLRGRSIYINIPFCPSKCSYCSYPTLVINEDKMDTYVEALTKEIGLFFKSYLKDFTSIYVGGGTPSALGPNRLERVLKTIRTYVNDYLELTVEVGRPDTISKDLLRVLKENGVSRISINPQTMKDQTLKSLNRNHSSKDVKEAFKLSKDHGFSNINMDLIIGLPGEEPSDFKDTLYEIKDLGPTSISVHSLALKKGSNLTKDGYKAKRQEEFEEIRNSFVIENEYKPYYLYRQKHMFLNIENISYSREGSMCLYNIAMMEDLENIVAFGLGASSKFIKDGKIKRIMNPRLLDEYVNTVSEQVEKKLLGEDNETK